MQFYPDDWLAEPGLRVSGLAARGLWLEILCLMFRSPERGVLLLPNGKPMANRWQELGKPLAKATGADEDSVLVALAELNDNGVFSTRDDGAIYCRRMVAESELSRKRADAGRAGAESRWDGKPIAKHGPSSSTPTSSSTSEGTTDDRTRSPRPRKSATRPTRPAVRRADIEACLTTYCEAHRQALSADYPTPTAADAVQVGKALRRLGYQPTPNGVADPSQAEAVAEFKRRLGLALDIHRVVSELVTYGERDWLAWPGTPARFCAKLADWTPATLDRLQRRLAGRREGRETANRIRIERGEVPLPQHSGIDSTRLRAWLADYRGKYGRGKPDGGALHVWLRAQKLTELERETVARFLQLDLDVDEPKRRSG